MVPEELQLLLKISYYTFLTPRNYSTTFKNPLPKLIHKVICIVLTICSSIQHLVYTSQIFPISSKNPASYFMIALMFLYLVQRALLIKLLWLDHLKFTKIFNILAEAPLRLQSIYSSRLALKYSVVIACAICVRGTSVTYAISKTLDISSIFSILQTISAVHSSAMDIYSSFLVPLLLARLRREVVAFTRNLALPSNRVKANTNLWGEICREVTFLQGLCDSINELIGDMLSACILISVLFLASGIHEVVSTAGQISNLVSTIWYLFLFLIICLVMHIAADIPYKMDLLKNWLRYKENLELVSSQNELIVLLNQLDSYSISAKASGYFPITYGVVVTVSLL